MLQVKRKSAFTLIELLVVVIIVAVLAAVGVPLLTANVERAKLSEAEAGLGTIRTAMRAEFAELGSITGWTGVTTGTGLNVMGTEIGLDPLDLNGRFFFGSNYKIASADADEYCITVTGVAGTAPKSAEVAGLSRSMRGCAGCPANDDGDLFDGPNCTGNPLN